jgi:hypothetical protein
MINPACIWLPDLLLLIGLIAVFMCLFGGLVSLEKRIEDLEDDNW